MQKTGFLTTRLIEFWSVKNERHVFFIRIHIFFAIYTFTLTAIAQFHDVNVKIVLVIIFRNSINVYFLKVYIILYSLQDFMHFYDVLSN